ncbi:cation:proton antiporter [Sandaracinus amylolyticus]|uniref:cation:proton antiporter n=1 Tax=Sandaracinus amylolyticus TaxID=927083 RepID=UPI001F4359A9|nr:cation:proton antiporter [Sandaracinus amylolyticus]UJR83334.1 Hypothetical protein I5071_54020 [Sandaracinus amylolyticus]
MNVTGTLSLHLLAALAVALVGAIIASCARQSVLSGFVLAGVVVGTLTPGPVATPSVIEQLAEIGIVFLMFVVGVQLSVRDLLRRGPRLLAVAGTQVAATILLGMAIGRALGWSAIESFAFGAVVSNSSSTVLARVVYERKEGEQEWGRIGFAWSSIQDLSTILLAAALTALAHEGEPDGTGIAESIGSALFYLLVLSPCALWLVPKLVGLAAAARSREIFLLSIAVMALAMAWLASWLGVSLALGAFVAGVVVSESDHAHRVLRDMIPLRDLFSGLFFVSVGMLIDPAFVASHAPMIALTAGTIVIGKGAINLVLARALHLPKRVERMVALGLAQSGEFSFLLATIGAERGVLSRDVFHVLVSGTIVSILLSPYVVGVGARVLRRVAPEAPGAEERESTSKVGHVVVCGHGRVGEVVARLLERRHVPYVVVEEDRRIVRALARHGVHAVLGDASNPDVLERADVRGARALVVCLPDRITARCAVENALAIAPDIDVYVRTHHADEQHVLHRKGATEAVFSELELALALGARTLRALDVPAAEVERDVASMRSESAPPPAPVPTTPEPA